MPHRPDTILSGGKIENTMHEICQQFTEHLAIEPLCPHVGSPFPEPLFDCGEPQSAAMTGLAEQGLNVETVDSSIDPPL